VLLLLVLLLRGLDGAADGTERAIATVDAALSA
jgi:hypothetical protein